MRRLLAVASTVLCCGVLAAAIGFYGCGSGGGGGGSDSTDATPAGKLTLRVTDAPADDLVGVNFCVTGVILKLRTEEEATAALETTEEEEEAPDVVVMFAAPKCFDLMDYQGTDPDTATFALLDGETVPEGTYGWAKAIVGDAWVELEDGTTEPLTIPAKYKGDPTVKIIFAGEDALLVSDGGTVDVTVEFDLRCAVILANGSYMLKPVCRVADTAASGAIEGTVASSDLGTESCKKGYVYAYAGEPMPGDYDETEGEPAHGNDPMTTVKVAPDKTFAIGFLPAGDYTLAFTCGGKDDDPGEDEAIVFTAVTKVTVPEGQTVEVTLEAEPGDEGAGNNLSFPVIWSDGAMVALRGTAGQDPVLAGQYAIMGDQAWYYQQDPNNEWQAENADWSAEDVNLHWVDWGDNLEAKSWPANQVVRVETVLFQDLDPPMYGYEMSHISGQGITEMWGTNGAAYDSAQATVYSGCARLTIQKLAKTRDDETLTLTWDAGLGEWTGDIALVDGLTYLFKGTVGEAADGPGFYGAEINVSGKVVYGYNWFIKNFPEDIGGGPGDYRVTFSLDQGACKAGTTLNTFITEATAIVVSEEEGETEEKETAESAARAVAAAPVDPGGEPDLGGATPALYPAGNLSYIDVRITEPKGSDDHGGGGGGPPDGKGPPDGTGGGGGPPEGKGPGAEHGE